MGNQLFSKTKYPTEGFWGSLLSGRLYVPENNISKHPCMYMFYERNPEYYYYKELIKKMTINVSNPKLWYTTPDNRIHIILGNLKHLDNYDILDNYIYKRIRNKTPVECFFTLVSPGILVVQGFKNLQFHLDITLGGKCMNGIEITNSIGTHIIQEVVNFPYETIHNIFYYNQHYQNFYKRNNS
jgi:hypothetical protein